MISLARRKGWSIHPPCWPISAGFIKEFAREYAGRISLFGVRQIIEKAFNSAGGIQNSIIMDPHFKRAAKETYGFLPKTKREKEKLLSDKNLKENLHAVRNFLGLTASVVKCGLDWAPIIFS